MNENLFRPQFDTLKLSDKFWLMQTLGARYGLAFKELYLQKHSDLVPFWNDAQCFLNKFGSILERRVSNYISVPSCVAHIKKIKDFVSAPVHNIGTSYIVVMCFKYL